MFATLSLCPNGQRVGVLFAFRSSFDLENQIALGQLVNTSAGNAQKLSELYEIHGWLVAVCPEKVRQTVGELRIADPSAGSLHPRFPIVFPRRIADELRRP